MKIQITMKTPDCLYYATQDMEEEEKVEFEELCKKWFEYDEYVTLEVDTENKTCIVKEV